MQVILLVKFQMQKYKYKISVAPIPLSLRNAGKIVKIIPNDDVQKISNVMTSGNFFISLIAEKENLS
jgi:hypothetical protein